MSQEAREEESKLASMPEEPEEGDGALSSAAVSKPRAMYNLFRKRMSLPASIGYMALPFGRKKDGGGRVVVAVAEESVPSRRASEDGPPYRDTYRDDWLEEEKDDGTKTGGPKSKEPVKMSDDELDIRNFHGALSAEIF